MAFRKVVSQVVQDNIKKTIGLTIESRNPDFTWDETAGKILVGDEYEVLMVVIPAQANYNTEVRHG